MTRDFGDVGRYVLILILLLENQVLEVLNWGWLFVVDDCEMIVRWCFEKEVIRRCWFLDVDKSLNEAVLYVGAKSHASIPCIYNYGVRAKIHRSVHVCHCTRFCRKWVNSFGFNSQIIDTAGWIRNVKRVNTLQSQQNFGVFVYIQRFNERFYFRNSIISTVAQSKENAALRFQWNVSG